MHDNKKLLIAKGILNGGLVSAATADHIYSSKEGATSALRSLEASGWITPSETPGLFYILKENQEIRNTVKELRRARRKKKELESKLKSTKQTF